MLYFSNNSSTNVKAWNSIMIPFRLLFFIQTCWIAEAMARLNPCPVRPNAAQCCPLRPRVAQCCPLQPSAGQCGPLWPREALRSHFSKRSGSLIKINVEREDKVFNPTRNHLESFTSWQKRIKKVPTRAGTSLDPSPKTQAQCWARSPLDNYKKAQAL